MRLFISFFFFVSVLLASDIASLLNKIEKNDDLSRKTKMESSGISYVITRYQLDMMQAKTLGDVLDTTIIGYLESRFGVVDPWSMKFLPYNSIGVRVFIDNQEISSGEYDNTLYLLGKLDISFVDHIEIYYMSPSYSLSNEPSYVIIKLYSKEASRDEGNRVALSYGTFKSNSQAFDYAKKGDYSLYLHLSRLEWNHKKYKVYSSYLSRDSIAKHFLLSVYNENTRYLLSAVDYDQNAFIGLSLDGDIKNSYINSKLIHFGVDTKQNDFYFKYFIDYGSDTSFFEENDNWFLIITKQGKLIKKVYAKDYTLTHSLNGYYKHQNSKNELILGLGYRGKFINFDNLYVNDEKFEYKGPKREDVFTQYIENNYQYSNNDVFTIGGSLFEYKTKPKNKVLKQYKIGNTYLFDRNNVFKFFYYHMEYMNANYLVSTLLPLNDSRPRVSRVFMSKYKKKIDTDKIEINLLYSHNKNIIIPTVTGLSVYKKDVPIKVVDFRYHHNYNEINDMIFEIARMFFKRTLLKRNDFFIFLHTHRYKKWQFFENLVYRKEIFEDKEKEGTNLNLGIKYDVSDNLSIGIKGYNLLNKRYKNGYMLVNVFNLSKSKSLEVPLYERSINISMEYTF